MFCKPGGKNALNHTGWFDEKKKELTKKKKITGIIYSNCKIPGLG